VARADEGAVVTSAKIVAVNARELRDAYDFVNVGHGFENSAWICLDTGKIYWRSFDPGLDDEELPEDIDDSDRYLGVPDQRDLNLGRRLALDFVAQELPDDYDTAAGFFRRRGAYSHFKSLLHMRGRLERWYEFESRATDEALREWCAAHGIEPRADGPES
jgi:hypothetical protein